MRYGGSGEGTYGGAGRIFSGTVTLTDGADSTITAEAPTGNYPTAAVDERLIKNTLAGAGVLSVQNLSTTGYSAHTARTSAGYEVFAWGYGNSGSTAIFAGRNYMETWSGVSTGGTVTPFVFCADGDYGRTGTPGAFRFYQRYTVDQYGTHFWKGVDYANTQAETVRVTEGGDLVVMKVGTPNAIDIPVSGAALYWVNTGGAPTLTVLGRDSAGALYTASVATAAYTKTASDVFTAGDSATAMDGRVPTVGNNWALADADTWGISTNKAYRSAGTSDSAVWIDSNITDATVEADITLSSVRASAGLVLRGVDASNYIVAQLKKTGAADEINIYVNTAGSFTLVSTLASAGLALNTTYNLRVGIVGNSVYVYLDGVFKLRGDTASHAAGDKQGLWSFIGASDDDGGSRWDNFIVTP